MIIESVELKNFRNYKSIQMDFDSGTNILYGDNAQGKTNILESLYLSATTKSHKGSKDKELINFDADEAHIKTIINKKDIPYRIDIHLKKNSAKGIAVNGMPIKKASELFGILNVVFFSPEDLNLIKNGPAERRRFLDLELCQLDKIYVYNMVNYNKVLNQRNQLLKSLDFNGSLIDTLDIWDEKIAIAGSEVIYDRIEYIKKLQKKSTEIYNGISGEKEELSIKYLSNVRYESEQKEDIAKIYFETMKKHRPNDLYLKNTTSGPHRDDIEILINKISARKFGSQGQQRSASLSMKLGEAELKKRPAKNLYCFLMM